MSLQRENHGNYKRLKLQSNDYCNKIIVTATKNEIYFKHNEINIQYYIQILTLI